MLAFALIAMLDLHGAVLCATRYTIPSVKTTTNAKFVQKLKADLRRNNDDYILGRRLEQTETPAPPDSEHSSAYVDDIEEVYRRALVERGTQQLTIRNQYIIGQAVRPAPAIARASTSAPSAPPAGNMIRETDDKPTKVADVAGGPGSAGGSAGKAQFRANDGSLELAYIPSPDQLDMAPAKGSQIVALRQKQRVCQRHVLIPEGPKYDSHGRVYLHAHPAHAARPYDRTRAPRLLLPRCCNCCKKSVLGCE